jgi:glycolate oxidase FAD binding subunit
LAEAGASVSALPGVGVVHGSWAAAVEPGRLRSLRNLCETKAGALVLEKAPPETKHAIDAWGERPSAFELMRRLKQEMDPGRILNAGRYVGGL